MQKILGTGTNSLPIRTEVLAILEKLKEDARDLMVLNRFAANARKTFIMQICNTPGGFKVLRVKGGQVSCCDVAKQANKHKRMQIRGTLA